MAGHSHWKQVKHKKGVTDAKRGQLFSKLVKEITVAAREGGANPDANPRLRSATERARAEGLSKDNIGRAIARSGGRDEGDDLFEFLYEAVAPAGVAILIEGITNSKNRTLNEVRHLLSEHDARLAEPGSIAWNFDKIGVIECAASPVMSQEGIELAIIESGATDFTMHDGLWFVETAPAARERVRTALEKSGVIVRQTGRDYKPKATIELAPDVAEKVGTLLDALSSHDDVQEVYTNLQE